MKLSAFTALLLWAWFRNSIVATNFLKYLSILAIPRFHCLYGGEGVLPEGNGQPPLGH